MRLLIGAMLGLQLGVLMALDLFMFRLYASDSALALVLPVAGLVLGTGLGFYGRRRQAMRL